MEFELESAIEILERTPILLNSLLQGISPEWIMNNEGDDTWSAFDVIGHLIVCDQTDFIPRAEIILSASDVRMLSPIDMFRHFEMSKGKTITDLLTEFESRRSKSIRELRAFELSRADLLKTAMHPRIGIVTLRELLATWVVHDLNHIAQVARVMAKQYKE